MNQLELDLGIQSLQSRVNAWAATVAGQIAGRRPSEPANLRRREGGPSRASRSSRRRIPTRAYQQITLRLFTGSTCDAGPEPVASASSTLAVGPRREEVRPWATARRNVNDLVEPELGRVRSLANKMQRGKCWRLELDELVSVGVIALCRVADRYDPARGATFWTFAQRRVKGAMLEAIQTVAPRTRGTTRKRKGRPPPDDVVLLPDAETSSEIEPFRLEAAITSGRLSAAIEALPETQRALIVRHYIGGEQMKAVARDLGYSQAWARRLATAALRELRDAMGVE